jgi:copper resistance protein C
MKTRLACFAFASLAAALLGGPAWAHAHLREMSPVDGTAIKLSPDKIAADFSEPLEPAFSTLTLCDAAGRPVELSNMMVGGPDGTTLSARPTATLDDGIYRVDWHVLSKDGHATAGFFRFTVKR